MFAARRVRNDDVLEIFKRERFQNLLIGVCVCVGRGHEKKDAFVRTRVTGTRKCDILGDEGRRLVGLAKSQTVKCAMEVTFL